MIKYFLYSIHGYEYTNIYKYPNGHKPFNGCIKITKTQYDFLNNFTKGNIAIQEDVHGLVKYELKTIYHVDL